jgi:hypothetical protein
VTEHEPRLRVADAAKMDAGRSMRCLDLEHRRGVCRPREWRRAMSFALTAGQSLVTETKGTHR